MAAVINITAPLGQIIQPASQAQKRHTRQLVRLFKSLPDNHPVRHEFTMSDKFLAKWLLDENSSLAQPEMFFEDPDEEPYPANWLTPQRASIAVAEFRGFTNLLPGWGPMILIAGSAPARSQSVLNIEVSGQTSHEIYQVLHIVAHTAMALLSCPQSDTVLCELFVSVTTNWQNRGMNHLAQQASPNDVVEHFLSTLQAQFPTLKLLTHAGLEGSDAEFRPQRSWANEGDTFQNFDPNTCGETFLNGDNVQSAIKAGKIALANRPTAHERRQSMKNWMTHLLSMSVSLAHELIHMFIVMLSGGRDPGTPLTIHGSDAGDITQRSGFVMNALEDAWLQNIDFGNIPGTIWNKLVGFVS